MTATVARIIAEAKATQNDQRYGALTHPVVLGLLIAADLLQRPQEKP